MAYKNKFISNPVTGQDIRFLTTANDSNGEYLEMESTYNARSVEPAPHYHPYQDEAFTVKEGELTISMDNRITALHAGESMYIPRNKVHAMWNNTDAKTVVNWQVQPAMNTEYLLETITGLAANGKVNAKGMPALPQLALIASKYTNELRLAKPPFILQKVLFTVIGCFGRLLGYKAVYKEHLD